MLTRPSYWTALATAAILAAGAFERPIARAATLHATPDKGCFVLIKGEIEAADSSLVSDHIERHSKAIAEQSLCLESPGGDFTAGIAIARLLKEKGISTRISADAECFSACAVAFMGGSKKAKSGDESTPARTLHINGKLGFHAPYFASSNEGRWSKTTVERLHSSALQKLAELIEMEAVSWDLLIEFGRKAPNEFLMIDTVDKAGRWDIALDGIPESGALTGERARTACFNVFGWMRPGPSLLVSRMKNAPCEVNCVKQLPVAKAGGLTPIFFFVSVDVYGAASCLIREAADGSRKIAVYSSGPEANPEFDDVASWKSVRPTTPINQLAQAIKFNPKDALAYNKRDALRSPAGFTTQEALDGAVADDIIAIRNRGLAFRAKGDLDRAIANFTTVIELNPKYTAAYRNRGLAYRTTGDLDRAIADYTKAIELNPSDAIAYGARSFAYQAKGELDRAIGDFSKAIELNPKNAVVSRARGLAYRAQGDLDRAISDFTTAIELNPKDELAYNNRGDAYRAKGDLDRSITDFSKAIELNPKYTSAYGNRGLAYRAKGDIDLAMADFTSAIEFATSAIQANAKDTSVYESRCWVRATAGQDLPLALADCNEALRLRSGGPKVLDDRALVFLRMGQLDEAIADYDAALAKDPRNAHSLYGRGLAKLRKGDQAGSDADIGRARALDASIADVYAAYGVNTGVK